MITRLVAMVFAVLVLACVGAFLVHDVAVLFDVRAMGFVVGAPWLVTLAAAGPREVARALRAMGAATPAHVPAEARFAAAGLLRGLAGQSMAVGLLVLLAGALRHLGSVAVAGGSVGPAELWPPFGALLLAPIYALVLATFVYAPLADALCAEGDDALDVCD